MYETVFYRTAGVPASCRSTEELSADTDAHDWMTTQHGIHRDTLKNAG